MFSFYCKPCCYWAVKDQGPCCCCSCICGESAMDRREYCYKFLTDVDVCCCVPCSCIINICNCPSKCLEDKRKHKLTLLKAKQEHELQNSVVGNITRL